MDDCIGSLGEAAVFSTIDCSSGSWQISVARDDRDKTNFTILRGTYCYLRMPFGLRNAPHHISARFEYHTQPRSLPSMPGLLGQHNRVLDERGRPRLASRYTAIIAARRRYSAEALQLLLFLASRRVFGTNSYPRKAGRQRHAHRCVPKFRISSLSQRTSLVPGSL